jgi:hypothetical protein
VAMEQEQIKADPAAIRADLQYMTARWHELNQPVVFEVRAFKENAQPQTFKFAPDWIDDAVDTILNMNALGYNIYAVRNPIRQAVSGSASDTDIVAAFFLWADCDDPAAAGNVYRFDGPKWSASVTTGRVPSVRVHTYWALEQPSTDLSEWREMQATIARHFGSDPSVINPSRIMRVGGTVAYPSVKKREKGYIQELTVIRTAYDDARAPVTLEQMARVFGASAPAQLPLSQQAAPALRIDTGGSQLGVDRERLAIQAMQGQEWHNAVIRLVASYVGKGLSDGEIHALTDPLTLSGYTVEQTRREVQQAIDGARRKGWTPEPSYASPAALQIATEASFDAPPKELPPLEWFDDVEPAITDAYIVKGVLSQGAMSVVYGPSNSGKTFFALDLAFHIAIGAPWRGRRVKQSAVLYLAAEGGRGVTNRIAALKRETGVCDVPLALRRAGLDLLHDQADLQELVDLARSVSESFPELPLLIVIDTLSRIMAGGDENSAADMTALIRNIDAIREATGSHIMLVHHTGKDTARGARGHSSLRAATDTEIEVGNDNGARAALVTKQRDYQGGETFAFGLKSVTLGHDQDGDEVTSCVVETVDAEDHQAAVAQKKGLGGNQKILADTFDQMLAEGMAKPNPGGVGLPDPGRFWCVSMDEFRTVVMGKMAASNKRGAFIEAWKALSEGRGLFCAASEIVWRTDRRVNK